MRAALACSSSQSLARSCSTVSNKVLSNASRSSALARSTSAKRPWGSRITWRNWAALRPTICSTSRVTSVTLLAMAWLSGPTSRCNTAVGTFSVVPWPRVLAAV